MKNFSIFALSLLLVSSAAFAEPSYPIRTRAERDAMTPTQVLQSIQDGNARFLRGDQKPRDFREEQKATMGGQHPSAVLLSCIDSRAPAEILFDKGLGEIFNARVAGNVANPDVLGSLEFACGVSGAKLVLVLGHSRCGAINGAIDKVEMGNLTGLLERIQPAVEACAAEHPKEVHKSSNAAFAEAVTRKNVELTVKEIRRLSPLLQQLEEKGQIKIQGALYDVETGKLEIL